MEGQSIFRIDNHRQGDFVIEYIEKKFWNDFILTTFHIIQFPRLYVGIKIDRWQHIYIQFTVFLPHICFTFALYFEPFYYTIGLEITSRLFLKKSVSTLPSSILTPPPHAYQ